MTIEIFIMAVIGIIVTIYLFKNNIQNIKKERSLAIEEKVASLGGEIVRVEHLDRESCPYSDMYKNPDCMYQFYRVRYAVGDSRKLGYAILILKQNSFGSSLLANTSWVWYF